jgi:hypothetical protein
MSCSEDGAANDEDGNENHQGTHEIPPYAEAITERKDGIFTRLGTKGVWDSYLFMRKTGILLINGRKSW